MMERVEHVYGFWLSSLRQYKVIEQGEDYLKIKDATVLRKRDNTWVSPGYVGTYFETKAEAIDWKIAQCRESIRKAKATIKNDERTINKLLALKEREDDQA